jgi:NADH:ubiquinone oxidoreductase subunit 2 (subunit N)
VSAAILVVVALVTAALAVLVSRQDAKAGIVALGLVVCAGVALASSPITSIAMGDATFALGTSGAGVVAAASVSLLLLLGAAVADRRRSLPLGLPVALPAAVAALAASLAAVDGAVLANPISGASAFQPVGTTAAPVAVAVVAAASVLIAPLAAWHPDPALAAIARRSATRAVRLAVVACGLAIAGMAWLLAPTGPIAPDPAGAAAGLLLVAAAVALFMGALPFHTVSVRASVSAPLALTAARGVWLPAAFALAAVAWDQRVLAPSVALSGVASAPLFSDARVIVVVVAVLTMAGGALAATFHDDVRHILAYALVGDAGLALLAFSSADPAAASAAAAWLPVNAVARTALVTWTVALVLARGTDVVDELDGWARTSPLLAAGLIGVAAATFGLPGWGVFELRGSLFATGGGPAGPAVAAAGWLGLLPLVRLAWVGARRAPAATAFAGVPAPASAEPQDVPGAGRRSRRADEAGQALRGGATRLVTAWTDHAGLIAAGFALAAAAVAIAVAWTAGVSVTGID